MKRILFLLLAAIALAACEPPIVDPPDPPKLASLQPAEAEAYYLEATSARSNARAAAAEGVASRLMLIDIDGQTGAITFYDADGEPIPCTVAHAETLADGRLALEVAYEGTPREAIVADPASGAVKLIDPIPDGWDYLRESEGSLYFVAASGLYRYDLGSGNSSLLSGPEPCSVSAWIKPVSDGVMYIDPSETVGGFPAQRWYPADGSPMVKTNLQAPAPGNAPALETSDGSIVLISATPGTVWGTVYAYSGAGGFTHSDMVLATGLSGGIALHQATPRNLTDELVLYNDATILRVYYDAGVQVSLTPFPAELPAYGGGPGNVETISADLGAFYIAFYEDNSWPDPDINRYHLWRIPIPRLEPVAARFALMAVPTEPIEIAVDMRISSVSAIDGQVFYVRDLGAGPETMSVNLETMSAQVYSSGDAGIVPLY